MHACVCMQKINVLRLVLEYKTFTLPAVLPRAELGLEVKKPLSIIFVVTAVFIPDVGGVGCAPTDFKEDMGHPVDEKVVHGLLVCQS